MTRRVRGAAQHHGRANRGSGRAADTRSCRSHGSWGRRRRAAGCDRHRTWTARRSTPVNVGFEDTEITVVGPSNTTDSINPLVRSGSTSPGRTTVPFEIAQPVERALLHQHREQRQGTTTVSSPSRTSVSSSVRDACRREATGNAASPSGGDPSPEPGSPSGSPSTPSARIIHQRTNLTAS